VTGVDLINVNEKETIAQPETIVYTAKPSTLTSDVNCENYRDI
jgi:hypothetical protein